MQACRKEKYSRKREREETDPLARIQPGRETGQTGFPPVGTVRVHLDSAHLLTQPLLAEKMAGK